MLRPISVEEMMEEFAGYLVVWEHRENNAKYAISSLGICKPTSCCRWKNWKKHPARTYPHTMTPAPEAGNHYENLSPA